MWIDSQSPPRPWPARVLAASLLGWGALALVLMLRWRGFFGFAGPALFACLALNRPLVFVRLRALLLTAGAVIAFLLTRALFPQAEFQPQMLGRLDVVCSSLLAIGTVASLHRFGARSNLLVVGSSYSLLVLSGLAGMALRPDTLRFAAITGGYVVCLVAFLYTQRSRPDSRPVRPRPQAWAHALLVGASLAVCGLLVPPVSNVAFGIYGRMLSASASALMLSDTVGMQSGRSLDLRQSPPVDFPRRSAVLLRVESPTPPGYLRGSCFDTYRNGRWERDARTEPMPARATESKLNAFRLAPSRAAAAAGRPQITLRVYLAPRFSSHVLHAPADALELLAPVDALRRDRQGTILTDEKSPDRCRAYSLTCSTEDTSTGAGSPAPAALDTCLAVPADIEAPLRAIAAPIFSGAAGTATARLQALTAFFDGSFTYELGVAMRRDRDPVLQFLQDNRRGHCSLFAAATALLLRTQGVPARVVSGFVCAEQHPSKAYWVARERTAHAWVEAFSAEEQRWVLVDNTPDDGQPCVSGDFDSTSALLDRLRFWRQRASALFHEIPFAELAAIAGDRLTRALRAALGSPLGAGIAVSLAALFAARLRRRRRSSGSQSQTAGACAGCLREFERLLRSMGIRRGPHQTIRRALADAEGLSASRREELLAATGRYELLRYRPHPSAPEEARRLENDIRSLRASAEVRRGPTRRRAR